MSHVNQLHQWTFLTNHSHVLICLLENDEARLRDVAVEVGITERAVIRIIADLEEAGFLIRNREGRRNRYVLTANTLLRHPMEKCCCVHEMLKPILKIRRQLKKTQK